jgi:hypothetical protein
MSTVDVLAAWSRAPAAGARPVLLAGRAPHAALDSAGMMAVWRSARTAVPTRDGSEDGGSRPGEDGGGDGGRRSGLDGAAWVRPPAPRVRGEAWGAAARGDGASTAEQRRAGDPRSSGRPESDEAGMAASGVRWARARSARARDWRAGGGGRR